MEKTAGIGRMPGSLCCCTYFIKASIDATFPWCRSCTTYVASGFSIVVTLQEMLRPSSINLHDVASVSPIAGNIAACISSAEILIFSGAEASLVSRFTSIRNRSTGLSRSGVWDRAVEYVNFSSKSVEQRVVQAHSLGGPKDA
jgi:hypothetical protein